MAKKTEIAKPAPVQLPAHMQEDHKLGTEGLAQFVVPPRLVIVQPLSREPLNKYDAGSIVIMPNEQVVSGYDKANKCLEQPFHVTPVFFFPEWTVDNPREIHAQHGAVRERTFDPNSELANKAQNPNLREFPCPEMQTEMCSYTTRLNYVLYLHELATMALVTFKRAEQRTGMAFNSLIRARNAPIFGGKYIMDVGFRSNDKGQWYGLDASNPTVTQGGSGGWVEDKDLYNKLKEEHLALAEAHSNKQIVVQDDEPVAEVVDAKGDF